MNADEQLREKMRSKSGLLRRDIAPMPPLRVPLACEYVAVLLLLIGIVCLSIWPFALTLLLGSLPLQSPLVVYTGSAVLFGVGVFAYAGILAHSEWFFPLRPLVRWSASVVAAIALLALFLWTASMFLSRLV